ncbi:MAG: 2-oxoacid:acceptor oxidoreductase subunit alpha [Desulfotomaculales bacterium]
MRTRLRLVQGNEAVAEAALAAGASFFAGYPITPSTEIAEIMASRLRAAGGRFIQMEDEIASMAAVIGAALTGRKAFTATSGPGFSLMQENIGFAAMAEVPCVIVNVQRLGPSTGIPTAPAQGDVMQARWGTHGDHPAVVFCPGSVREAYDLTVAAFNTAERLRTPVILLLDEIIAHMREGVELPDPAGLAIASRPRPSAPPGTHRVYRGAAGEVPEVPDFGTGYRFHVTGLVHDENGKPSTSQQVADEMIRRLHRKVELARREITFTVSHRLEDARVAVIAYGSVVRSARRAVQEARSRGVRAGLLQLQTLWPFPEEEVAALARRVRFLVVAEINLGQLAGEVKKAAGGTEVVSLTGAGGKLFTPEEILEALAPAGGRRLKRVVHQ